MQFICEKPPKWFRGGSHFSFDWTSQLGSCHLVALIGLIQETLSSIYSLKKLKYLIEYTNEIFLNIENGFKFWAVGFDGKEYFKFKIIDTTCVCFWNKNMKESWDKFCDEND